MTLFLSSNIHSLRQVGSTLTAIAILWLLYLRFRAAEPDQQRINERLNMAEQSPLGVGMLLGSSNFENPNLQTSNARLDRTPVERLISDDK